VNTDLVAALAAELGAPLAPERLAEVAVQLQGQLAGHRSLLAEELEGVEPAIAFDPAAVFQHRREG
jgi:hypothetical protein